MAFSAGLKPYEFDSLSPQRIWNVIDAHSDNEKAEWERTRTICYNVAKFGNSDPKRFPRDMQKFWPFPWENKVQTIGKSRAQEIMEQHQRMVERRKQLENKIKNG